MVKIEIEGKEYKVPSKWEEINIKQYQKMLKLAENATSTISGRVKVFQLLSGIDMKLISGFSIDQFNQIMNKFEFVTQEMPKLEEKDVRQKEFIIKKKKYKLMNFEELTLGEWVDLDILMNSPIDNLHNIMAIMLKHPKEKEYDTEQTDKKAEMFLTEVTALYAMKFLAFFLSLEISSLRNSMKSLKKKLTKKELVELREKIGDGWDIFMN